MKTIINFHNIQGISDNKFVYTPKVTMIVFIFLMENANND